MRKTESKSIPMKKLSFLLIAGLVLLGGAFTSCEKIAEEIQNATEITINTTLDAPIVAVPEISKSTDGNAKFNEFYILDIANNVDLKDHLDKIQSLELTEIEVTIVSATPNGLTLIDGLYSITDNVNGDSFSFNSPSNLPLVNGSSFKVDENTPGWNTVNAIIASKNPSTLRAIGTINNETFEVNFNCSLKVKAVVKQ